MVKRKTTRKGPAETVASPRGKQSQDAPVTDTVMQVITRRIRNARKKLQKVTVIEELIEKNHKLNEDQERVYTTKAPLTAVIDELLKLEPLVEAALANELEEATKTAKEHWNKGEASAPVDTEQGTSETGESEVSVEDPSGTKDEGPSKEAWSQEEEEGMMIPKEETRSQDEMAEAIYFLQLFAKGRFDLKPFVGEDTEEGVLTEEEAEMLESYGQKMFQTMPHVPQDALESIKEAVRVLFGRSSDEASQVFEAVSKLKLSEAMSAELKPTVHGFPIAIDKEESDTVTEPSDDRQKTETVPAESTPPPDIPPPADENPPPCSPVQASPPTFVPDAVPVSSKGPRPFLPFPGVAVSGGTPMGYTMTQPPMMGMHSYFSMAPPSGNYVPYPTQAPSTGAPPPSHEHITEPPVEEGIETGQESKEDIDITQPSLTREDVPDDQDLTETAVTSTPDAAAPAEGDVHQPTAIVRPRPGGGDYRPYQGPRGRHPYSGRQGPRGRGRGRGRRPYDNSNPTHRPYAPDRHPYDRRKRGGYQ